MSRILILYSTTDGHTRKICLRLQEIVEMAGNHVTLSSIDQAGVIDLKSFDKIIIGASIRYGKHSPAVYRFIKENAQLLDSKPNAFFSVNVVARKAEKNMPDTNPYLKKFLKQIAWKPKMLAVFAGKIDYQKYNFLDRTVIRLIMWFTRGPTDPKTNIEFTDWSRVEEFALVINEM
ncbi:MAG: menaquinone-dependent protoporphyrinogen IX dehydrogenase [Gammaproteobacteria bacterium]|jgi:menaquinone-dependent protoporphyrinogen oxidase|nr:menaquinone-dependent protoporphyrinogen IX dehydrogenase [Gammaproteobacteria bacterium]